MITHRALIHWSRQQQADGLPTVPRLIDPAWFDDPIPPGQIGEGWSLVCEFDVPPVEQGTPSAARVHFLVERAPHERLVPGVRLELFERESQSQATVEILE